MKKNVKQNYIYNATFQIILLMIPLITMPYVSRVLGADNIGQYSYATSIVTYFVVAATFGSTIFGQKTIAFYRDNQEKMSESFWNVLGFRMISGIVFFIIYIVYIVTFEQLTLLKILVSLNVINVIVDVSWFYQGIEEFKCSIFRSVIIKVISLICIYVFVKTSDDTWIYTLSYCASMVVGNIILWIPLRKYILSPKRIRPLANLKDMFMVFIPTIASQVYTVLDKSMIGWITGSDYANGCYEQSERLVRAALTMVTAVGAVVLPRVANLYKKGEIVQAREYVYKAYRVVWALGFPLMFGTISIASVLIPIYLGSGYDLSIILLQIFSFLIIFVSLSYVTGISYLTPTNQQNVYTFAVIVAAVLNFGVNYYMIPKFGAIGAAIASVLAECTGVVVQIGYCIYKRQMEIKKIFGTSWKYFASGMLMYVFVSVCKDMVPITIWSLLLLVFVGMIIYLLGLFIFQDDLLISNLKLISRKLKFVK